MFFKNALVYRFNREVKFDAAQLEAQLKEQMFTPCGATDTQKFGWIEPTGNLGGESMIHAANGNLLITAQLQTKKVETAVLNKRLKEKVEKIEAVEGRPLKKAEKDNLKGEIIIDLLPRVFEKDSYASVLIMPDLGLLVVDTTSSNKAEDVLALLRKTIGSLPVVPAYPKSSVESVLTEWVKTGETPAGFDLLDKVVLSSVIDQGGKATLNHQDLTADEVLKHIESDKMVTRLDIDWQERIKFTLSDDFSIKGLKWADELKDQNDDIPKHDELARFDADFALFTGEIRAFLAQLFECFDGLPESTTKEDLTFEEAEKADALVKDVSDHVRNTKRASVAAIQRNFKIGYNRAARIMGMLEALKVVSPMDASGNREVLV